MAVQKENFKISITKLYFCFTFLVIIFTAITSVWISYQNYNEHLIKKDLKLESELANIAFRLDEKLGMTDYLMSLFMQKIKDSDDFSLKNIKWLLRDDEQNYKNDLIAWTFLNYVNADLKLKAYSNQRHEIEGELDYKELRPKIVSGLSTDKKLFFDKRAIGLFSKVEILPMAMRINDKAGNFKGLITAGLDLKKLNQSLSSVTGSFASYIVLDEEFDYVTAPDPFDETKLNTQAIKEQYLRHSHNSKLVRLDHSFKIGNYVYSHIRQLEDYPLYVVIGEEENFYYNKYRQYVIPEVFRNVLIGIIFSAGLLFLSYNVIKPILELSEDATTIYNGKSLPEHREYISEEFNMLSSQLFRIQDLATELRQKEKEAHEVNKKLKAANSLIRSNISFMTHELKNPNFSIIGFASLINPNKLDKREQEALNMIVDAAKYQSAQIQYFLDLFEFQFSGREVKKEFVDLKYLVHWSISMLKNMADERGIRFHTSIQEGLPYLLCDGIMFGQMFQNLISNSIKYNNEHGNISVSIRLIEHRKKNQIQLIFEDDGIGISDKDQKIIFDKFTRVSLKQGKSIGHGLGLAYVKKCVMAHSGTIHLKSSLGKGLKLILRFDV